MKITEIIQGRYAPLYHGTGLVHLVSIINDDTLEQGIHWGRPHEPEHGVRLTRSLPVAWTFADQEVFGGVLVLDQNKLRQRFRIVPYRDIDAEGNRWSNNEMEEIVLAEKIPVSPFLIAILVDPDDIKQLVSRDNAEYATDTMAIFDTRRAYMAAARALLKHPLLKAIAKP